MLLNKVEFVFNDKNTNANNFTQIRALSYLIAFNRVTPSTIKNYTRQIGNLLLEREKWGSFFVETVPWFYRAGIWLPEYWTKFL